MALKEVKCYNCGSNESTYFDTENGYTLVKCSGCGLLYVNPRPSEEDITEALKLGIHQGEEVKCFTGVYKPYFLDKYATVLSDFFPEEKAELKGKKWLDIGCGYGEFLQALDIHSKGELTTIGSEPNEIKMQYARKNGLDVSYIDLASHHEMYDFISLLNVFSHLPDPPDFFSKLKKNLNPGGEIFLQTGHTCHLSRRQHIKPYQLPDHLSFANQEIVENIFRRLGFEIVDVRIYKPEWHPYTVDYYKLMKDLVKAVLFFYKKRRNPLFPRHKFQDMFIRCRLN
jgi:SAM-dependent methyltransferase